MLHSYCNVSLNIEQDYNSLLRKIGVESYDFLQFSLTLFYDKAKSKFVTGMN